MNSLNFDCWAELAQIQAETIRLTQSPPHSFEDCCTSQ